MGVLRFFNVVSLLPSSGVVYGLVKRGSRRRGSFKEGEMVL